MRTAVSVLSQQAAGGRLGGDQNAWRRLDAGGQVAMEGRKSRGATPGLSCDDACPAVWISGSVYQ